MRLDFGLDLVVLISEKKSLGVFVSSHLSHFIIEMSHRKLENSVVLKMNKIMLVCAYFETECLHIDMFYKICIY